MQETSPPGETGLSISGFKYNNDAILDAFEFKKANDPAFKNVTSLCAFAEKFGLSESTCKRVFKGRATDFTVSVLWYICKILGLDPAVVLYLAPSRDYAREERDYNPTLMDNLRRQIASLEERIAHKKERIDELTDEISKRDTYEKSLRERFLRAEKDLSTAMEKAAEIEKIKKQKHHLALCLFVSAALTITFGGFMIYFLWELQNPDAGNWQF